MIDYDKAPRCEMWGLRKIECAHCLEHDANHEVQPIYG